MRRPKKTKKNVSVKKRRIAKRKRKKRPRLLLLKREVLRNLQEKAKK